MQGETRRRSVCPPKYFTSEQSAARYLFYNITLLILTFFGKFASICERTSHRLYFFSGMRTSVKLCEEGAGTEKGGLREKWPKKVGRREKSERKCREEGENEMLGVGRDG